MNLNINININDHIKVDRRQLNNILAATHSEVHDVLMNSKEDGFLANRKEFNIPYQLEITISEKAPESSKLEQLNSLIYDSQNNESKEPAYFALEDISNFLNGQMTATDLYQTAKFNCDLK